MHSENERNYLEKVPFKHFWGLENSIWSLNEFQRISSYLASRSRFQSKQMPTLNFKVVKPKKWTFWRRTLKCVNRHLGMHFFLLFRTVDGRPLIFWQPTFIGKLVHFHFNYQTSCKKYRPGHPNVKFQLSMLLMKNPQFWCNLSQTFRDWPHHWWVNSWKFE